VAILRIADASSSGAAPAPLIQANRVAGPGSRFLNRNATGLRIFLTAGMFHDILSFAGRIIGS